MEVKVGRQPQICNFWICLRLIEPDLRVMEEVLGGTEDDLVMMEDDMEAMEDNLGEMEDNLGTQNCVQISKLAGSVQTLYFFVKLID